MSGTVSTGCVNRTGDALVPGLMSFPIAIKLSPDEDVEGKPKFLFVTSSNFALQYNSGNVQAYDIEKLVGGIESGCISSWVLTECLQVGLDPALPECQCEPFDPLCTALPTGVLNSCLEEDSEDDVSSPACECDPGPDDPTCTAVPPDRCSVVPGDFEFPVPDQALLKLVPVDGLITGQVAIGSFSDGLAVSTNGRRLYLPVRSDSNITWIDVNEQGQLSCGEPFGVEQTCMGKYRDGAGEKVNPDVDIAFPSDPVDVFVGDLAADFAPQGQEDDPIFNGDYILVAHREGRASLLIDQVPQPGVNQTEEKRPRFAATVEGLAPEQVTITRQPGSKIAWVPSALTNSIVRVGIGIDGDPTQSYLFNAGTLFVTGLDRGTSNRDILFDPRPDQNLAYIVSRSPEALLVARTNSAGENLTMIDDDFDLPRSIAHPARRGSSPRRHRATCFRKLLPLTKREHNRHREASGRDDAHQCQWSLPVRHRRTATSDVHGRLQHVRASRGRSPTARRVSRRGQRCPAGVFPETSRPGRLPAAGFGASTMTRFTAIVACALLLASCQNNANNVVLASLARSEKIALVCGTVEQLTGNLYSFDGALPLDLCQETNALRTARNHSSSGK